MLAVPRTSDTLATQGDRRLMTSLSKFHRLTLGLLILFAVACASGGLIGGSRLANLSEEDTAKLAKWDQERVTKIAAELAPAMAEVFTSINKLQTGSQIGSGQANAFLRLKDRVRVARNEARHLAKQLEDGKNRMETVHTYSRLMTTIRDAREEGRRGFIEAPTLDKIATAADLVRRLSPYYDPESGTPSSSQPIVAHPPASVRLPTKFINSGPRRSLLSISPGGAINDVPA